MEVEEESVSGHSVAAKGGFNSLFLLYHPTAGTKISRERLSPEGTRRAARGEGVRRNENRFSAPESVAINVSPRPSARGI